MKTRNNSKSFSTVLANLLVLIFSLVGITVIINWISTKVSNLIMNLISPEAKKKAAIKAVAPLLKEGIKNVKPVKFSDLEKTMGSLDKVVKEVINEDQVPENIKEKIENEEASKTKTFVNGKNINIITALTGANKIDQFIYDCRCLKRSRIGGNYYQGEFPELIEKAKNFKKSLTQMEKDFRNKEFTRSNARDFLFDYINIIDEYIIKIAPEIEIIWWDEAYNNILKKYFGE